MNEINHNIPVTIENLGNFLKSVIFRNFISSSVNFLISGFLICASFFLISLFEFLSSDSLINNIATEKLSKLGMKVKTSEKSPLDGAEILANSKVPGVYSKYIKVYHSRNL